MYMFSIFRKDPIKKLGKLYESKPEEAMYAKCKGNIKSYDPLCTLHQYCSCDAVLTAEKYSLIPHSAKGATLDAGGWLNPTRQGPAPCKIHQASLNALTPA